MKSARLFLETGTLLFSESNVYFSDSTPYNPNESGGICAPDRTNTIT